MTSPHSFSVGGFHCTLGPAVAGDDPCSRERIRQRIESELARLIDPASAQKTLHWGRNYLYVTSLELASEPLQVVVKQFRNHTLKAQLRRRMRGSKAARSFEIARALEAIGVRTPEPLLLVDSKSISGPSFFVCRHVGDALELRYFLRALNSGDEADAFPAIDPTDLLRRLGRLARSLHDHRIWHRDLTSGNVLVHPPPERRGDPYELYLLDLNRARVGKKVSFNERARELGRMPILLAPWQEVYLEGYYAPDSVSVFGRSIYRFHHRGFLLKNQSKKSVRGFFRRLAEMVLPRRKAHVHIPEAEATASVRDKIVWDRLSDQPHQHASRFEKLRVRLADAPTHAAGLVTAGRALVRARSRALEIRQELYRQPVAMSLPGVCLRPWPQATDALLEAFDELGAGRVLLRLHPWEDSHQNELDLAVELAARGVDLAFALPQTRDLVRDPERWRLALLRLGEVFLPFGKQFQIGQAINRSKWGVWKLSEYTGLFTLAHDTLKSLDPDVELLGPSVIDFEPHATASALNVEQPAKFDISSHLLYVDRRGAPENRQMGLDTVGKVVLLKALAETSRNCPSGRCWITEMNWPLWEGPHSPAGRDVAVSEERQADYLLRYMVHVLSTGLVERVYWWQLIAKGYGLVDPDLDRPVQLRRRPSFHALRRFLELFDGAVCLGREMPGPGGREIGYRFRQRDGEELVLWWDREGALLLP